MRHSIAITFVLLATIVCTSHHAAARPVKPTDAEITKGIVGRWEYTSNDQENVEIKGIDHYRKDGTFTVEGRVFASGKEVLKISVSGTWKVSNGNILATIEKADPPENVTKGQVSKEEVISVEKDQFKTKTEKGKEKTYKRLKD